MLEDEKQNKMRWLESLNTSKQPTRPFFKNCKEILNVC